jgi:hypothetical protein
MAETSETHNHTLISTLLLLVIVFISSFISLCIPLGRTEWLRPVISTLLFSSVEYMTFSPYGLGDHALRKHHIQNSMKMYIGSVIAGSQPTIRTPLVTTGSFALLTGLDKLSSTLFNRYSIHM